MNNSRLNISLQLLTTVLTITALLLVSVSLIVQYLKFRVGCYHRYWSTFFDVSLEQNLPTFFTVLLMLLISLLLLSITLSNKKSGRPFTSKWAVLSVGFLYMAYDEGFHVHEDLVAIVRPMLGGGKLGVFYYAWVVPGIILVFLLLLFFSRFLLFLSLRTRLLFLTAGTIYLSGAIGLEMIGGYYDELYGWNNLTYNIISTLEESLEMAGLIFYLYALLSYLENEYTTLELKFH